MVKKAVVKLGILRHTVATVVSIATPAILVVVGYFVMLLIAIFSNTGLGGPFALPFWVLITIATSTIYTSTLLFLSVALAEVLARFFGKWHHVFQIPISTIILAILTFTAGAIARIYPNYQETITLFWADHTWIIFLILCVPLGIYLSTKGFFMHSVSLPFTFLKKLKQRG